MRSPVRLAAVALLLAVLGPAPDPAAALQAVPTITYKTGANFSSIIGQRMMSAGLGKAARDYAAFWGVPYAKPPVGDLRFKPPVRVPLPEGTFSATNSEFPICLQQMRPPSIAGAEDCLTLQIFTPNFDYPNLDVIVFLHGGAFTYGKGPRTGLQYIMDHDVVVVNVDYRIGILGFLSFEDEEMPGNLGLHDQVAALQWVQENIGIFGGNKQSVTVVGFSAGSASALLHSLSPLSGGLFHKMIGMSGSPLNPWAHQRSARANALRVAELTNCTAPTTAAMVACLQRKNATDLVGLQAKYFQDELQNPFAPFGPVVDSRAKRPFMPDQPRKLLREKKSRKMPMLLSFTSEEGLYPLAEVITKPDKLQWLDKNWTTAAANLLHLQADMPEMKLDQAHMIREHYLHNSSLTEGWRELVQLTGDQNFIVGVAEHARMQAAAHSQPVYVYSFAYRGEHSLSVSESGGNRTNFGVSHADDLQYFIEFLTWSGEFNRPDDIEMRKQLIEMWINFANSSIPVLKNVTWTPLPRSDDGHSLHYVMISSPNNKTMVTTKDIGHTSFWRELNHSGRLSASLSLSLTSLGLLIFARSMSS